MLWVDSLSRYQNPQLLPGTESYWLDNVSFPDCFPNQKKCRASPARHFNHYKLLKFLDFAGLHSIQVAV